MTCEAYGDGQRSVRSSGSVFSPTKNRSGERQLSLERTLVGGLWFEVGGADARKVPTQAGCFRWLCHLTADLWLPLQTPPMSARFAAVSLAVRPE